MTYRIYINNLIQNRKGIIKKYYEKKKMLMFQKIIILKNRKFREMIKKKLNFL